MDVILRCPDCRYEETREREEGESYDGTKCPNCEGEMLEVESDEGE